MLTNARTHIHALIMLACVAILLVIRHLHVCSGEAPLYMPAHSLLSPIVARAVGDAFLHTWCQDVQVHVTSAWVVGDGGIEQAFMLWHGCMEGCMHGVEMRAVAALLRQYTILLHHTNLFAWYTRVCRKGGSSALGVGGLQRLATSPASFISSRSW
jgi:hypothetical protein